MTLLRQALPSNSCKARQLLRGPAQQLHQGGHRPAQPATRYCSGDGTNNVSVVTLLLQALPSNSYKAQPSSTAKEVTSQLVQTTRYCSETDPADVSILTLLLQDLPSSTYKALPGSTAKEDTNNEVLLGY